MSDTEVMVYRYDIWPIWISLSDYGIISKEGPVLLERIPVFLILEGYSYLGKLYLDSVSREGGFYMDCRNYIFEKSCFLMVLMKWKWYGIVVQGGGLSINSLLWKQLIGNIQIELLDIVLMGNGKIPTTCYESDTGGSIFLVRIKCLSLGITTLLLNITYIWDLQFFSVIF